MEKNQNSFDSQQKKGLEGQMAIEKELKCVICGEKPQITEIAGEERFGGGWKSSCACAEATYRDHSAEGREEAIKSWQKRVDMILNGAMSPKELEQKVSYRKILVARVSNFASKAIDEANKVERLIKEYADNQEVIEEEGNENPYVDVMNLHTVLDNIQMYGEQASLAFTALRKTSKSGQ